MAEKDKEQPRVVTATVDHVGEKEDELSFHIGEHIQIVGKVERGWYEGVKFSDKKLGVFPELYVEADKDVEPLFLYCKALNDFAAKEREKLSYKKNDFFEKLRPTTRLGCMKGTLVSNQTRGYFEASNVLFLTKEEAGAQMTLIQKRKDLMASLIKNADKMDKSSAHVDPPQKTQFVQPASQSLSVRGSSGSVANTRGQMTSVRGGHGPSAINETDQAASQSLSVRGSSGSVANTRGQMTSVRGGHGPSAINETDQAASQSFSTRGSSGSFPSNRGQMSSVRGGHGPSGINETDQTASHGFSTRGSDGSFANTRGQMYSARGGRGGPSSTFVSRGNRGNGFGGNRGNGYNSSVNKGFGANDGFGNKPAMNNEETFGNKRGGRGFYSAQLTARPPPQNSTAFDQSSNNQGFHGQSTPNQIANSPTFAADNAFRGNRGGGFNNGHNGFFGRGNGHNSSGDNRVGFGDNNGCGNNRGSFRGHADSKPENKFGLTKNAMVAVANNDDPSGKSTDDDVKTEKPTDVRQQNSSAKHDPQETEKKLDGNIVKPSHNAPQTEVPKLPDASITVPLPPLPEAPKVVDPGVAASTTNDGNAGLVVQRTKGNNGAASETMDGPFQEYPGIVNIVNGIRTQLSSHPEWRNLKITISGDQTEDGQISMKTEGSCEYHQMI